MTWPKITVVTPSFNQSRFLDATLKSIHNQQYPNLEHIIIDGGSTDGSVEIIRNYENRLTYWVSEPDKGQTDALIKGFSHATGEICCWLNSDDLFTSRTLWQVAEAFIAYPDAKFIYGDAKWIDEKGGSLSLKLEIPFNRFIWLYNYNYLPQPSCFWRDSLYKQVGGLNPSFDLAMDADLWARFSETTTPIHIPQFWSEMRRYSEQKNQRLRQESDFEDNLIRKRYIKSQSKNSLFVKKYMAKIWRGFWIVIQKVKR